MSAPYTPAMRHLDEQKIPYRLFIHSRPLHSLEQAARERNQSPNQVVRSILFRTGEGQFVMVLMPGPRQVSWQALRKHLGKSRLTMATSDEVKEVTGYEPGTVSPFGLPVPIPILLDQNLLAQSEVSIGSGERGVAIILQVKDLLAALGHYEVASFSEPAPGVPSL